MVHFIAKRSLLTALLNTTSMLEISFFAQIFQSLSLKKDKFYVYILWITKSYKTLKSHKKQAHAKLIF